MSGRFDQYARTSASAGIHLLYDPEA